MTMQNVRKSFVGAVGLSIKLPDSGQRHPKSQSVNTGVMGRRGARDAYAGTTPVVVEDPKSTPNHVKRILSRFRYFGISSTWQLVDIKIPAPFRHVAVHVIKTPRVR